SCRAPGRAASRPDGAGVHRPRRQVRLAADRQARHLDHRPEPPGPAARGVRGSAHTTRDRSKSLCEGPMALVGPGATVVEQEAARQRPSWRTSRRRRRGIRAVAEGAVCALGIAVLPSLGATESGPKSHLTREYDLKAAFLFNFAQFVEWPAESFPDARAPI